MHQIARLASFVSGLIQGAFAGCFREEVHTFGSLTRLSSPHLNNIYGTTVPGFNHPMNVDQEVICGNPTTQVAHHVLWDSLLLDDEASTSRVNVD
jgi:hypothetical protein